MENHLREHKHAAALAAQQKMMQGAMGTQM
jgi:hypothetical protein